MNFANNSANNHSSGRSSETVNRFLVRICGILIVLSTLFSLSSGKRASDMQYKAMENTIRREMELVYGEVDETALQERLRKEIREQTPVQGSSIGVKLLVVILSISAGIGLLMYQNWGRVLFLISLVLSSVSRLFSLFLAGQVRSFYVGDSAAMNSYGSLYMSAMILAAGMIALNLWLFVRFSSRGMRTLFR